MTSPGVAKILVLLEACDSLADRMEHNASLPVEERLERASELGLRLYALTWKAFPETCEDWLKWKWPRGISAEASQAPARSPCGVYDSLFHVAAIMAWRSELRLLLRWLDDRGAVPAPYSWNSLAHRFLRSLEAIFPRHFLLWVRASSVGREPTNWIPDEDLRFPKRDDGQFPPPEPT
jgi:hypothetical protein